MNAAELARYEAGLSVEQAAELAQVGERTIRRIESGESKPQAPIAKALAKTYGVTVAQLLGVDVDQGAGSGASR